MEFKEALKTLGIEEYASRIFNSNSHGELLHLEQYCVLAESFGETEWFAGWFKDVVKFAEENWGRPESVFQYISQILISQVNKLNN